MPTPGSGPASGLPSDELGQLWDSRPKMPSWRIEQLRGLRAKSLKTRGLPQRFFAAAATRQNQRRGGDSNPRYAVKHTPVFETGPIGHSGTSPFLQTRQQIVKQTLACYRFAVASSGTVRAVVFAINSNANGTRGRARPRPSSITGRSASTSPRSGSATARNTSTVPPSPRSPKSIPAASRSYKTQSADRRPRRATPSGSPPRCPKEPRPTTRGVATASRHQTQRRHSCGPGPRPCRALRWRTTRYRVASTDGADARIGLTPDHYRARALACAISGSTRLRAVRATGRLLERFQPTPPSAASRPVGSGSVAIHACRGRRVGVECGRNA
jgi:hypothetical protein